MKLQTVTGLAPVEAVRLADAHTHAWIEPPLGAETRLELHDFDAIQAELADFKQAGGTLLVDCQPGGCGRDARQLRQLSDKTGLLITAVTGFHQRKYYPPDAYIWTASAEQAATFFIEELTVGMAETDILAALLKIGYEGVIEGQTRVLMEAVAEASRQTGAGILFHTEAGKNVEALLPFFEERGVAPARLYLCHVDKRPDFGLHRELAEAGLLLGYDTFLRPKYQPETGVWPLLRSMVGAGLRGHVAIGLDLARASMWRFGGGELGLLALPNQIIPRLRAEGFDDQTIVSLTAQNIARFLVRVSA
jgi:phosphotriesterase-related protein